MLFLGPNNISDYFILQNTYTVHAYTGRKHILIKWTYLENFMKES